MASHPHSNLPDYAYWRRAVINVAPGELDPVVEAPFRFDVRDNVATAGSCFAQPIGRYLKTNGCNYLVTERRIRWSGRKPREFSTTDYSPRVTEMFIRAASSSNCWIAPMAASRHRRMYGKRARL